MSAIIIMSHWANYSSKVKGPMLSKFSDPYFSSWTPLGQPPMINYPQNTIDFQKTAYLSLCLQPPAKTPSFSFMLKLTVCAFHIFGNGQKQGDHEAVSRVKNAWRCCH